MTRGRTFLLALLVLFCSLARAAPPADTAAIDLTRHWQLAVDPGAQWRLADALAHAQDFKPATARSLAPGYTAGALWARLEIPADQLPAGELWLMMSLARLERVELWQQGEDGQWRQDGSQLAGVSVPQRQWPVDMPQATFELKRPAGQQNQPLRLLLRQTGRTAPSWDALLCTPRDCARALRLGEWVSSLVIGGQLLVAVICVLLFLVWRERVMLLLGLYAVLYGLYEFTAQGWGFQLFWPEATDWAARSLNVQVTILQALQTLGIVLLLRRLPRPAWVLLALAGATQLFMLCAGLWGDYRAVAPINNLTNWAVNLLTLGITLWAWRRRMPQSGMMVMVLGLTAVAIVPRFLHVLGLMRYANPLMLATPVLMLAMTVLVIWLLIRRMADLSAAQLQAQALLASERETRGRELEQLVGQRTAELSSALQDAEQLHQQRSRLLAYIGHDLRAPLSATVSYLQQLSELSVPGPRDPREQGLHASIEQVVAYQLTLIDELLEFTRGELHEMELLPEPIYTWGLLRELAAQGELLARLRGNRFSAEFAPELPPVVQADAKRLRQLLLNLLSNAAKFTVDGHIRLTIAPASEPGQWSIQVRDDGIGIDPQLQQRLFAPAQAAADKRSNRGLGLLIARHIVEAMGGQITLHSAPGAGSAFHLTLPMPASTAEAVQLAGTTFGALEPLPEGCAALLIDTPPAHADRVAEMLFAANIDVARASRLSKPPGSTVLLLCDPVLLGDTGLPLLKLWRAASPLHRCIALLDRPPTDEQAAAFDALLYKPLDAAALMVELRRLDLQPVDVMR